MTLIKPIITEKSIRNYNDNKQVTFVVNLEANKSEIKKAIEQVYEVEVSSVKVINRLGKVKNDRLTRKVVTKTNNQRIAIARLKEGNTIDLFEVNN